MKKGSRILIHMAAAALLATLLMFGWFFRSPGVGMVLTAFASAFALAGIPGAVVFLFRRKRDAKPSLLAIATIYVAAALTPLIWVYWLASAVLG